MSLATIILYVRLSGFVFFPIDFDVFNKPDLVDFCKSYTWDESDSVYWISGVRGYFDAVDWLQSLGFNVI